MKIFIETERLVLREITLQDVNGMFEMDSDPEVHKYLGNNPLTSLEQSQEIIKNIREQYKEYGIGRWAIIEKASGDFIGWSGLKYELAPINKQNGYYDLGYRLRRKYWGKGIATETAIASLKYGFTILNLKKICAGAEIENIGSNKILRNIGMNYIESFIYDGKDCNWYTLKKKEWQKKN